MAAPIDSFEVLFNEQRAELAVFRITLTMFILRLVGANPPTADARIQDLKSSVIGAIGRIKPDHGEQGQERMKQMTAMRADKFFLELEEVVSETLRKMAEMEKTGTFSPSTPTH
jgi:hypothetical protein